VRSAEAIATELSRGDQSSTSYLDSCCDWRRAANWVVEYLQQATKGLITGIIEHEDIDSHEMLW